MIWSLHLSSRSKVPSSDPAACMCIWSSSKAEDSACIRKAHQTSLKSSDSETAIKLRISCINAPSKNTIDRSKPSMPKWHPRSAIKERVEHCKFLGRAELLQCSSRIYETQIWDLHEREFSAISSHKCESAIQAAGVHFDGGKLRFSALTTSQRKTCPNSAFYPLYNLKRLLNYLQHLRVENWRDLRKFLQPRTRRPCLWTRIPQHDAWFQC